MHFYAILKAVSMVATGVFGVLGILHKDNKGKEGRAKRIAIAGILVSATLSLVLYGLEAAKATEAGKKAEEAGKTAEERYKETKRKLDTALEDSNRLISLQRTSLDKSQVLEERLKSTAASLDRINTASQSMARKQAEALLSQKTSLAESKQLEYWQIRSQFPLEPVSVEFEREIPMLYPELTAYAARLKALFTESTQWNESWEKNYFGDEPYIPKLTPEERDAYDLLARDGTSFVFGRDDGSGKGDVTFTCHSGDEDSLGFIGSRVKAKPHREILLRADFEHKIFVQTVRCENLIRGGGNIEVTSSLDLVGRILRWQDQDDRLTRLLVPPQDFPMRKLYPTRITKIEFILPYDYQLHDESRTIHLGKEVAEIRITGAAIGLSDVYKAFKKSDPTP